MGNIVLLDELTINKIAAGEVIERPASVVKEMVENSIDAGAKNITVEIKNGGISLIKVTDDGSGIAEDDMEIAFERHATSKIRQAQDLETITTMGFRGEALASIASISNVEMTSKREEDETGHKIVVEAGRTLEKSEVGVPVGTSITVKNLFFNTPVRYKFLKKDFTEAGYIEDVITRIALINKNVAIKLINTGKTVIQTNGSGDFQSVIYSIYGKDIAKGIMDVDYTYEDIKVTGVVGKGELARNTRVHQLFFVNNRYIKDKNLTAAVDQAYKGVIPSGKHGFVILNVGIDPKKVDVNVHPAKLEVRFEEEGKVFKAVYHAIKSGLAKGELVANIENPINIDKKEPKIEEEKTKEEEFKPRDNAFSGFFKKILKEPNETKEELENNNLREIFEYRQNAKESVFSLNDVENNSESENLLDENLDVKNLNNKLEETKNFNNEVKKTELSNLPESEIKPETLNEKNVTTNFENNSENNNENNCNDYNENDNHNHDIEDNNNNNNDNENNENKNAENAENDVKKVKLGNTIISSDTKEIDFDLTAKLNGETLKVETTKSIAGVDKQKPEIIDNVDENQVDVQNTKTNAENIDSVTEKLLKMKMESGIDDTQFVDTARVRENLKDLKGPLTPEFVSMYKKVFGTDVQEVRKSKKEEEEKINGANYLKFVNSENENVFEKEATYVPEIKYKFIGIVFSTYIIISIKDEMFLIDQHAAHERIMYEKVKANYYSESEKDSQMLLLADVITLTHKEMNIARENVEMFKRAGFDFEEFGENTIKLISVPSMCEELNTKKLFLEILDEIDTVAVTAKQEKEDKFIATIACKAAVKGNMKLDAKEVDSLMQKLLKLPNPFSCPHGRPTAIKITLEDLEKKFSRR